MKKRSVFYPIYFAVTGLVLLAMIVGAFVLRDMIASYEASQPIHPAEDLFTNYFLSKNFEGAVGLSDNGETPFESASDIAAALSAEAEGKELSFYSVSQSENEAKYAIIAGNEGETPTKLATMTFRRGEKDAGWGMKLFQFDSLHLDLKGKKTVRVSLPSDSVLLCNGKEVSRDFIASEEPSPVNAFLPEGVPGITLAVYELSSLYAEPNLRATDAGGLPQKISYDEESASFCAETNYSEELKAEYADYVLAGAKAYAAYMQNDGNLGTVRRYFDPSSDFYREVRTTPTVFVWDHTGYTFENEVIDQFYAYDENTFSCHVSFTHILTKSGSQNYTDKLDMTLFLRKINGEFKIYDRILNG